jgi:group I intron endonuclease
MPEAGIYCIENVENGKMYIGKGKNVNKRMWQAHEGCVLLEKAIKKYGDAIIRYVIEYCEPTNNELDYWEQYYIKEWNTKVPNGYNLTDGGGGVLGQIVSDETRQKSSVSH